MAGYTRVILKVSVHSYSWLSCQATPKHIRRLPYSAALYDVVN